MKQAKESEEAILKECIEMKLQELDTLKVDTKFNEDKFKEQLVEMEMNLKDIE